MRYYESMLHVLRGNTEFIERERGSNSRGLAKRGNCCTMARHFANKLKQLLCAWGVSVWRNKRWGRRERDRGREGGGSKKGAQCAASFQTRDLLHGWDHNMCIRASKITTLISQSSTRPCSETTKRDQQVKLRERKKSFIKIEFGRCPTSSPCFALTPHMFSTFKSVFPSK